jgi:hypothetical protein
LIAALYPPNSAGHKINMKRILLTLLALGSLTIASYAQDFNNWTTESFKLIFGGPVLVTHVHGKIKTVTFPLEPHHRFHGPEPFGLILSFLRGPKEAQRWASSNPNPNKGSLDPSNIDCGQDGDTNPWVDHQTGYIIADADDNDGTKWHLTVTKNDTTILRAEVIDSELDPKIVLRITDAKR